MKSIIFILSALACSHIFGQGLKRLKFNNPDIPYVDLGVGLWASPLPMDYDDDGDMDLVVSCTDVPFSGTYFYENTGERVSGELVFAAPIRIGEGMRNVCISYVDGEPVITASGVEFTNFKRFAYDRPEGIYQSNEILDQYPKKRFNNWYYVDYEGDGDQDLIVGVDDWLAYGWDNAFNEKGEWTNGDLHGYVYLLENVEGKYINRGKLKAGNNVIDVYGNPTPNMADFDGDGDLDIICGEFVDSFTWFENTGSRTNPKYATGKKLMNHGQMIRMDLEMMRPVAVDWDGNGTMDLIVGDEDGRVAFIENTGDVKGNTPVFKQPAYLKQEPDNLKFGGLVTPYSVDWDNDGDEDLICGNTAGYIAFIENLGGNDFPSWAAPEYLKSDGEILRIEAGMNGSIQGPAERRWGYTTQTVADWDGDGLKDIIINSIWGKIEWYQNIGTAQNPKLGPKQTVKITWGKEIPKPKWNWWDPGKEEFVTQWRTTPYAIDWNRDGLMDIVMLDHEGYLAFFERFKKRGSLYLKPGRRVFKDEQGEVLRLNQREAGGSGRRKLTFVDWDLDGDLDMIANSRNADYFENLGIKDGITTYKNHGQISGHHLAGHTTSPTTVDWNKDGKPDLVIGAEDGHFYYLENK